MEAYPGDPYAYMPSGRRRFSSMEGILPLILLIVIAFFVLQFLGVIPCIIPVGCGGEANVLVIGSPSTGLMQTLSSKEASATGIIHPIYFDQDFITIDILNSYQVVILQNEPFFDMDTREVIKQYVDAGGKLIVIGNAGAKHDEYANVASWAWPSGQGIPVPATLIGSEMGVQVSTYGHELRMAKINHPIVSGLQVMGAQLRGDAEVFKVQVKNGGQIIAAVQTIDQEYTPAIIEGGSGLGKVIYFAYDPGYSPEILLTAIKYLAGV